MINNICEGAKKYWNDVPKDLKKATLESGISGTLIGLLLTRNLSKTVNVVGISVLATTIYGLVTPLFKKMVEKESLNWKQELFRWSVAAIGASAIFSVAGFANPQSQARFVITLITMRIAIPLISFAFSQDSQMKDVPINSMQSIFLLAR